MQKVTFKRVQQVLVLNIVVLLIISKCLIIFRYFIKGHLLISSSTFYTPFEDCIPLLTAGKE